MHSNDRPRTLRAAAARPLAAGLAALLLLGGAAPAGAQGRGFGGGPHLPHGGGGHGGGHGSGIGRAHAAIYEVLTVSAVTDASGLKASLAKLGPSLAGSGGRMVVDADDPSAIAGTAPAHLAIVVFDSAYGASNWQSTPAFKAVTAEIAKTGTLQILAVGGVADPGAPPSVPVAALGPAPGRNKLPDIPKIADICKGC